MLFSAVAAGCDKKSDAVKPGDTEEAAPTKGAADAPTKPASAPGSAQKPADAKPGEAKAKANQKKAPSIPGRSAIPTLAEWNTVTKEVTVKGSTALNCETKMMREWLRVSCRGKNDTGGTPRRVRVVAGDKLGTYVFASGGVSSLVTPFVEGIHLKAVFSWTDKSHQLVLVWPRGSNKPTILGSFAGAKSPLDPAKQNVSETMRDFACKCEWKELTAGLKVPENEKPDCRETYVNEDCYRTYSSACELYAACARGEPGHGPTCRSGYHPIPSPFNQCVKPCRAASDCDKGQSCEPISMNRGAPTYCLSDD